MAKRITSTNDNMLAWGVSSIFLGIMLLLHKLNILSQALHEIVFDWKNYFLYIGAIFFLCKRDKTIGIILLSIGLLFRLQAFFRWQQAYIEYLWPLLFTVIGIIMVLTFLRKR